VVASARGKRNRPLCDTCTKSGWYLKEELQLGVIFVALTDHSLKGGSIARDILSHFVNYTFDRRVGRWWDLSWDWSWRQVRWKPLGETQAPACTRDRAWCHGRGRTWCWAVVSLNASVVDSDWSPADVLPLKLSLGTERSKVADKLLNVE